MRRNAQNQARRKSLQTIFGRNQDEQKAPSRASALLRPIIGGVPRSARVKLKYVDIFSLQAGSGLSNSINYGLNCCYDPYLGVGGHQPSNFDRMMQLYERYTVTGCAVKLSYFNNNSSSGIPQAYGMLISSTGSVISASSTAESILEQPPWMVKYSEINSGIVNGPYPGVLRQNVDIGEFFGVNRERLLSQDSFSGTIGANPTDILYLEVFVASLLGNTPSANSSQYKIELVFDLVLSQPLPTVAS